LHNQFGLREFYLADLDAIAGGKPGLDLYVRLRHAGFPLMVDAGVSRESQAEAVLKAGVDCVLGLETLRGPEVVDSLCSGDRASRLIFSLDLKEGRPLGDLSTWNTSDPWVILSRAVDSNIQRILVLDLARVGMGQGVGSLDLCRRIKQAFPHVQVMTGGGVRHREDLQMLEECGIDGVLAASALHDGRLVPEDVKPYCRGTL
jgi:phosphoribosylformimino-5-aminoimidazole carboxamide ribotide isomerase